MMNRFSWFGVALIVVGAVLLLDRIEVVSVGWSFAIWALIAVFGLVRAVDGFARKKPRLVFWGTLLFLLGTYSLLRDIDVVELRSYWWLPAAILILGFSFLMMYLSTPRDWHLLVPSAVLLGIGTAMVLTEYGYLYRYDVVHAIRMYWPLGLIVFGVSLILSRIFTPSKTR